MTMNDNYDLWQQHNRRQEAWLERQPTCCRCKEKIQDEDLWDIFGELYCEECAKDAFRANTEDYEA